MGEEYIRQILLLGYVPTLGPVVLYDDMEGLQKWTFELAAGDFVLEKSATVAYNGSASLHMKTRTTGAVAGDLVGGYRTSFQRPGKRYRVEFLMRIDVSASAAATWVQCSVCDGMNAHYIKFYLDEVNAKWQYLDSANNLVDLTGGTQDLVADQFHRVMFEFDEESGKYITFVCDGLEVDMTGISYRKAASASAVNMKIEFVVVAGATPPGELYIDDVLVMEM